ncbi:ketimine reductase mu-crystallin isoform X1 [Culex pipiens pallens]|uniref:ketimine reductase mu-crystallin isoform X1 n=2 Tax=Culex pipiens pallens TaxID=42434 RepID=UPI001952C1E0|nr:ketimine reductase mu-crystallin isoform X1 [Culex pipiens pallens]
MASHRFVHLVESELIKLTNWKEINHVLEQAFVSVSNKDKSSGQPYSSQPARSFVHVGDAGALLCMPAFLGNISVKSDSSQSNPAGPAARTSSLACKLITSFKDNPSRNPPLPDIIGNIFLFDETTGQLQATLEANYLTGLRTAAASIVATEQVFLPRIADKSKLVLGIIGTGVQGEFHAMGFMKTHKFVQVKLWNRTKARSEQLKTKLTQLAPNSCNPDVNISVHDSPEECCTNCDIIVTATSSSVPIVFKRFLKQNVHINAIGSGLQHHTELAQDIYDECSVFIDYWNGAKAELATLKSTIVGEVGEVVLKQKVVPSSGITVFQSLGMAVEDAAIGKLFYSKYMEQLNKGH